ncbi:MAG TPA: MlaD family protein [Blastocatellia bacterium]|jgi:phospholipid/cholesterol/gamma-HCH transport system substrate-binding protein
METKKVSIGIFVVGGLILFGVGMFLIGDRHQIFARHVDYYSEFVNLAGLATGAKVRVAGMDAGQVLSIDVPDSPSSQFRVKWRINEKLRGLVREDSVVSIGTEGVVGGTFLAVRPGSAGSVEAEALATIPSKEPTELSDLVSRGAGLLNDAQGMLREVGPKLGLALDTVTSTVSNVNDVVAAIKEGHGTVGMLLSDDALAKEIRVSLATSASNIREVIGDLKDGRGVAGMLLRDETVSSQVRDAVKNVEQATVDFRHASGQADSLVSDLASRRIPQKATDIIDSLSDTARQVNQLISDISNPNERGETAGTNVRESLTNANIAAANLAEATEALKHNFLTRGFFKKRGYYTLAELPPEKYRRDRVFTNPANRRAWLSGSDLFQIGSKGNEELSARGKALLNATVTAYGDSVVESPIVIEGYWNGSEAADQLRLSRSRAMLVRQYLQQHYQIVTKNLGVVPMKNSPPNGTQRSTWDGICLVVLKKT